MRKAIVTMAVSAVAIFSLTACGAAPEKKADGGNTESSAAGASDFTACLVSDQGGFNDKSFNQSAKKGIEDAAAELGLDKSSIKEAESKAESEYPSNIQAMVSAKCNLIIGVGFSLAKDIRDAAVKNPNINFAIIDSSYAPEEQLPNLKALVFKTSDAAYLAGYVAAGMSKTGTLGTYLGMKLPTTAIFADGFEDGMKKYNEDFGKDVKLVGWDKAKQDGLEAGAFNDLQKGEQLAENLLSQGADVIMPVAGGTGLGSLNAIKAKEGAMAVWVDSDGYESTSEGSIILTTVAKGIPAAVASVVKEAKEGKFSNADYVGTLANGGVEISPYHDFESKVPAELKEKVDQLKQDIIDGKIKVESVNDPK